MEKIKTPLNADELHKEVIRTSDMYFNSEIDAKTALKKLNVLNSILGIELKKEKERKINGTENSFFLNLLKEPTDFEREKLFMRELAVTRKLISLQIEHQKNIG